LKGYAFSSKEDFERASAAYFEVEERHGMVRNLISDRIYFVLDGMGDFIIDNEKVAVQKGDVIIVPRNTNYDYQGKLKLFLVHSPAYDPKNDIDIEGFQTQ
jgi:mannose-6-phosphate isomerase-like protein (cupin superfamily)